jgi:hypothetical protein
MCVFYRNADSADEPHCAPDTLPYRSQLCRNYNTKLSTKVWDCSTKNAVFVWRGNIKFEEEQYEASSITGQRNKIALSQG